MNKKIVVGAAIAVLAIAGMASASWFMTEDVAEVVITIEKPILVEKMSLQGNVSLTDGGFELSGDTEVAVGAVACKLAELRVEGLSREEKKQFDELELSASAGGEGVISDANLLSTSSWVINERLEADEVITISIQIEGQLSGNITRDAVGFDVVAVFTGVSE